MDAADKKFLIKHGFKEDKDKSELERLTANKKLKKADISVSLTEPSMLLARGSEKNTKAYINDIKDKRLIIEKGDTVVMNIILDEIRNCMYKRYDSGIYDFEFEVHDLRCSFNMLVA